MWGWSCDSDIETGTTVYTVYAAWDGFYHPLPKRYRIALPPGGHGTA